MSQWYYAVNQERKGPVDDAALAALAANGIVTNESLVWREGMSEWQPYGQVSGSVSGAAAEPAASFAGAETAAEPVSPQSIQLGGETVTEANKEAYVQKLREGVNPSGKNWRYGGFWIRFGAYVIDYVLMQVISYAVLIPLALAMEGDAMSAFDPVGGEEAVNVLFVIFFFGLSFGIPALYYTLTTGSSMQGTLGKKLVGLRVIREDGQDVTYGVALGRYLAALLSGLICAIGYIMAAFDEEKRALHDLICGTRVIER